MKEKISPYLRDYLHLPAVAAQYVAEAGEETLADYNDPLREDAHEPVKGLVHKYGTRALIKVSYQCASHCRFCTRIRQIGRPEGTLREEDFGPILAYLAAHPGIEEIILSGGDPLYTPKITATLLERLILLPQIKVFRIGTRLPLHLPRAVAHPSLAPLLNLVDAAGREKPFFILLHINHPDELSPESLAAIRGLRCLHVTLLSQTVFLRGVNDDAAVLTDLFTQLYHAGVIPYYLYHCDAVRGLERFVVPLQKEIEIVQRLHAGLSGIACPRHVIDVEDGYGKVPLPSGFWPYSLEGGEDFSGGEISP